MSEQQARVDLIQPSHKRTLLRLEARHYGRLWPFMKSSSHTLNWFKVFNLYYASNVIKLIILLQAYTKKLLRPPPVPTFWALEQLEESRGQGKRALLVCIILTFTWLRVSPWYLSNASEGREPSSLILRILSSFCKQAINSFSCYEVEVEGINVLFLVINFSCLLVFPCALLLRWWPLGAPSLQPTYCTNNKGLGFTTTCI